MNAITLDFLQEIVIPNLFKVLFKVNTPFVDYLLNWQEQRFNADDQLERLHNAS
jgi:hypothetical protein